MNGTHMRRKIFKKFFTQIKNKVKMISQIRRGRLINFAKINFLLRYFDKQLVSQLPMPVGDDAVTFIFKHNWIKHKVVELGQHAFERFCMLDIFLRHPSQLNNLGIQVFHVGRFSEVHVWFFLWFLLGNSIRYPVDFNDIMKLWILHLCISVYQILFLISAIFVFLKQDLIA